MLNKGPNHFRYNFEVIWSWLSFMNSENANVTLQLSSYSLSPVRNFGRKYSNLPWLLPPLVCNRPLHTKKERKRERTVKSKTKRWIYFMKQVLMIKLICIQLLEALLQEILEKENIEIHFHFNFISLWTDCYLSLSSFLVCIRAQIARAAAAKPTSERE